MDAFTKLKKLGSFKWNLLRKYTVEEFLLCLMYFLRKPNMAFDHFRTQTFD